MCLHDEKWARSDKNSKGRNRFRLDNRKRGESKGESHARGDLWEQVCGAAHANLTLVLARQDHGSVFIPEEEGVSREIYLQYVCHMCVRENWVKMT